MQKEKFERLWQMVLNEESKSNWNIQTLTDACLKTGKSRHLTYGTLLVYPPGETCEQRNRCY
jgi:hypothetical protein